ncbi:hypothetical protein [Amycolatopsis sp. Hca4]|uniref:hypothetical protein n=1 Tax=Amycolatopsis sp. Hca4 TaxID=2742131 RepID=UPI0015910F44|nr:hypothetical protein [Amycolatopsis sp. Hca4]QKV77705.1 hypothetical protein HUT10_30970 [Amycolatopsis sp. Hca4]
MYPTSGMAQTAPDVDHWYTSGTFLTIAGIVVAAIMGVGAIVATYRSANPRRRLHLYQSGVASMVHIASKTLGIKVLQGDQELQNPHLVTVNVSNRGRRDIPRSSFDGPITLDVGVEIVGQLNASSSGTSGVEPMPEVAISGTALVMQPSLIKRKQTLSYSLLVDGKPTWQPKCAIVDVEVDTESSGLDDMRGSINRIVIFLGLLIALSGLLLAAASWRYY